MHEKRELSKFVPTHNTLVRVQNLDVPRLLCCVYNLGVQYIGICVVSVCSVNLGVQCVCAVYVFSIRVECSVPYSLETRAGGGAAPRPALARRDQFY